MKDLAEVIGRLDQRHKVMMKVPFENFEDTLGECGICLGNLIGLSPETESDIRKLCAGIQQELESEVTKRRCILRRPLNDIHQGHPVVPHEVTAYFHDSFDRNSDPLANMCAGLLSVFPCTMAALTKYYFVERLLEEICAIKEECRRLFGPGLKRNFEEAYITVLWWIDCVHLTRSIAEWDGHWNRLQHDGPCRLRCLIVINMFRDRVKHTVDLGKLLSQIDSSKAWFRHGESSRIYLTKIYEDLQRGWIAAISALEMSLLGLASYVDLGVDLASIAQRALRIGELHVSSATKPDPLSDHAQQFKKLGPHAIRNLLEIHVVPILFPMIRATMKALPELRIGIRFSATKTKLIEELFEMAGKSMPADWEQPRHLNSMWSAPASVWHHGYAPGHGGTIHHAHYPGHYDLTGNTSVDDHGSASYVLAGGRSSMNHSTSGHPSASHTAPVRPYSSQGFYHAPNPHSTHSNPWDVGTAQNFTSQSHFDHNFPVSHVSHGNVSTQSLSTQQFSASNQGGFYQQTHQHGDPSASSRHDNPVQFGQGHAGGHGSRPSVATTQRISEVSASHRFGQQQPLPNSQFYLTAGDHIQLPHSSTLTHENPLQQTRHDEFQQATWSERSNTPLSLQTQHLARERRGEHPNH